VRAERAAGLAASQVEAVVAERQGPLARGRARALGGGGRGVVGRLVGGCERRGRERRGSGGRSDAEGKLERRGDADGDPPGKVLFFFSRFVSGTGSEFFFVR